MLHIQYVADVFLWFSSAVLVTYRNTDKADALFCGLCGSQMIFSLLKHGNVNLND